MTITRELYHDIVQQSIVLCHEDECNAVLQQDNACSHVSKDFYVLFGRIFW